MANYGESYSDTLNRVYEQFGKDKVLIPLIDVANWMGVCWETLRYDKTLKKTKVGRLVFVNQHVLARWLS